MNSGLQGNNEPVEQEKGLTNLGSRLCEDWLSDVAGKTRISFIRFRNVVTNFDFELNFKIRFTKCYVWSAVWYGMYGYILKDNIMSRLEPLEIWISRRILKVTCSANKIKKEILRKTGGEQ